MTLLPQETTEQQIIYKICEICGKRMNHEDMYSFLVQLCVTGPSHVQGGIQCDAQGGQHWGCSMQHAIVAAQICLDEHMTSKHTKLVKEKKRT